MTNPKLEAGEQHSVIELISMADEHSDSDKHAHRGRSARRGRLFLSYARSDASDIAGRLRTDLEDKGFEVWLDSSGIRGGEWEEKVKAAIEQSQVLIAILTPCSVRTLGYTGDSANEDSVCLDELAWARYYVKPQRPIVPVRAGYCEPPFCVCRLHIEDLSCWRDSEEQYRAGLERIVEGIDEALAGRQRYRNRVDDIGAWDFESFLSEKRRDFSGREWLIKEIKQWCEQPHERALLICGDPGIGKSALVSELVHRNYNGDVLAYYCCQADTPETLEPATFVCTIASMIASRNEDYSRILRTQPPVQHYLTSDFASRDPRSAFEGGVLSPLARIRPPESGVQYIAIDALDEALAVGQGLTVLDVLSTRLERMPGWLRVVATTRQDARVLERLAALRPRKLSASDPRNLEDVRMYIERRLAASDLQDKVITSSVHFQAVCGMIEKGGGNFLWTKLFLDAVAQDRLNLDQLDGIPPGIEPLYQSFMERLFPDDSAFSEAKAVLEVLAAAREPLTDVALATITDLDIEDKMQHVLRSLSWCLRIASDEDGTAQCSLFHKSFADWLCMRGNTYRVSLKRGNDGLAEICWQDYAQRQHAVSEYAMRHLPAHLLKAGRWQELERVLCDLQFLQSRLRNGLLLDCVADYRIAADSSGLPEGVRNSLREYGDYLRRRGHVLQHYPGQLLWDARNYAESGILAEKAAQAFGQHMPVEPWLKLLNLPQNAVDPVVSILSGHRAPVEALQYSVDGSRLVSVDGNGQIRVWDVATGQCAHTLIENHTSTHVNTHPRIDNRDHACAVAFSPDATRALVICSCGQAAEYFLATGAQTRNLTVATNASCGLYLSRDEVTITGRGPAPAAIYDLTDQTCAPLLDADVASVALAACDLLVAVTNKPVEDASAYAELWPEKRQSLAVVRLPDRQEIYSRGLDQSHFSCISVTPSGKKVVLSGDFCASIFDIDGCTVDEVTMDDDLRTSDWNVIAATDGEVLVSMVGTVAYFWGMSHGDCLGTMPATYRPAIAVSCNDQIAVASQTGAISLIDARDGAALAKLPKTVPFSACLSPTGTFAVATCNQAFQFWDITEAKLLREFPDCYDFSWQVLACSGEYAALLGEGPQEDTDTSLEDYDPWKNDEPVYTVGDLEWTESEWDKELQRAAYEWEPPDLYCCCLSTGCVYRLSHGRTEWTRALVCGAQHLIAGSSTGRATIFSLNTFRQVVMLRSGKDPVTAVAATEDCSLVAVGDESGAISVWSIAVEHRDGADSRGPLEAEGVRWILPDAVPQRPDDGCVAEATDDPFEDPIGFDVDDQAMRAPGPRSQECYSSEGSWDPFDDGESILESDDVELAPDFALHEHCAPVRALVLSVNGALIASASEDGVLKTDPGTGHSCWISSIIDVSSLGISADNGRIVAASESGLVLVWDTNTGHLTELRAEVDPLFCHVDTMGSRIVCADHGGRLKVFALEMPGR